MTDAGIDQNKLGEIENAEKSLAKLTRTGTTDRVKPFGIQWPAVWWLKWATIHHAFRELGVPPGARVLDIGSGTGWSTLLLAEAGYRPTGVDIAPANVQIARLHAQRWNSDAEFRTADMDTLDLAESFEAILMFDALHHVDDPAAVVDRLGRHLDKGGCALFGEPSVLHLLSPGARGVSKEKGWIENGIHRPWCTGGRPRQGSTSSSGIAEVNLVWPARRARRLPGPRSGPAADPGRHGLRPLRRVGRWSRGSFGVYGGGQSILVGTPSGVTLAAEGGAHQSVGTPSIGLGAAGGSLSYEPAFALETMMGACSDGHVPAGPARRGSRPTCGCRRGRWSRTWPGCRPTRRPGTGAGRR